MANTIQTKHYFLEVVLVGWIFKVSLRGTLLGTLLLLLKFSSQRSYIAFDIFKRIWSKQKPCTYVAIHLHGRGWNIAAILLYQMFWDNWYNKLCMIWLGFLVHPGCGIVWLIQFRLNSNFWRWHLLVEDSKHPWEVLSYW